MSIDINQTISQASLDNLNDIIISDAVGLFPLAPGWIIVVLLLLALVFHMAFKIYKRYERRLYKREALKELNSYSQESRDTKLALLTLAKRVAISAYGRKIIARLSEDNWWDFMEQHSKVQISKDLRTDLSDLLYDPSFKEDRLQHGVLKELVTLWIKTHRAVDHD